MIGPFRTEADTRPVTRPIYASQRSLKEGNRELLDRVIVAAGIEMGEFDHRTLDWLAGWEPFTVAVVAGLIDRAWQTRGREVPPGFDLVMYSCIRDAIEHAEARGDDEGREQAGLYRVMARKMKISGAGVSR